MPDWLLITLIVLGSLLGLFVLIFLLNGIVFTGLTFRRRKGDKDFAKNESPQAKKEVDRVWYFSKQLEEITLVSYDKLKLKGYFLNNNSNKLAILVHGYHGRYYSVTSQARIFYENGYDVLCINNRCHDTSEGRSFSMGKKEAKDTSYWINLMLKRNPNYEIALYGISMGGHIAMKTAADINVNEKVKCIIEDCGYYSLKEELVCFLKNNKFPMSRLIVNLAEIYSKIFYGFSYSVTIKDAFKTLKKPILLLHGEKDIYVPTQNINLIYDVVPNDIYKEKHIFEGSEHTKSVVDHKDEYREILNKFVDKYIK